MLRTARFFFTRLFLPIGMAALLCSCASDTAPRKPQKPETPVAGAERFYAQNLSLARLQFIKKPSDLAGALPYLNKLNAYALGPHAANAPFTIVQLYFTEPATGTKYIAFAPIAPASDASRFDHLAQLVTSLKPFKPEYYRVQVRNTHFAKLEPISVWRTDAEAAQTSINRLYSAMNTNAQLVPRLENAALKLELTEFFTEHALRDAAYLSLESAKGLLASAAENGAPEAIALTRLSEKLVRVENTLNKKLPYRW